MNNERKNYVIWLKNILNDGVALSDIKAAVPVNERAFFNMLVMTALRQLAFIKTDVLPRFIRKKIPQKQNILNFVLYLGCTELLFLETPDYACINSYVEVAKRLCDKFGANFVNAVLRNVIRNKQQLLIDRKTMFFSKEFVKILKQDYTPAEIADMEKFAQIEAPLDLTLKVGIEAEDFADAVQLPTGTLRLPAHTAVAEVYGYNDGLWWVQDAASALAVKALPDIRGKKVLDLCAAPGGKTAQLLDAGAFVTAVDVSAKRLERLKENIERLHLEKNLNVICADALDLKIDEKFDVILVDAPCSATGTFRRHPEIMNNKTIQDVKAQAALQQKILNHCVVWLKENGMLVYATCSLAKLEGEKQIKNFLQTHADFTIYPIHIAGTEKMITKEGFLRVLPQNFGDFSGADGFFVAALQRKI